jgi:ubiquinone biosynthesis protein COQ4
MQRYRECHDFYHSICGLPVIVEGEIALKWFEWANMGLPVAGLSAVFGPLRFAAPERKRLREIYVPWAVKNGLKARSLINVYWEEELKTDADVLRKRLGIDKPPSVREFYPPRKTKSTGSSPH